MVDEESPLSSTATALVDAVPIPRYRVVTSLGSGGTAQVYLALLDRGAGFKKLVVLKTLLPHLADEPSVVEMFRNEARLAARLEHPNVVEAYEVVEDDARPVLVMEYLRGASLQEVLRSSVVDRFPLVHHLEVLRRTCDGLHYCHELRDFDGTPMGLVHRDVSPHNIHLTLDGEVRLLDFGIAKIAGADGGTSTGVLKGKIRYMAPEQMMGEQVDRRADIYAVGVLLWEAISGREMWTGLNDAVILGRVVSGELPPIDLLPDCPPQLVAITQRCLEMSPAARWSSCAELGDAIAAAIRELPAPHRPMGACVEALFGDRDAGVAALVQTAASAEPSEGDATIEWTAANHHPRRTVSRTVSSIPAIPPAPRARWPWIAAVAALTIVAVVASVRALAPAADPEDDPPPTPAPEIRIVSMPMPEAASPQHGPADTTVNVRLSAVPPEARLKLDGHAVGSNPFSATLERDGRVHTLSASAPGHATQTRSFTLEQDVDIMLQLLPARRAVKKKARNEPEKPACDPPFVVDDKGVKRFKRECL